MHSDWIEIRGLEVESRIGVPDEERAAPQKLRVDLRLQPLRSFSDMADSIDATVDYHAVALRVAEVASGRVRKLIEILADDIAQCILREFAVRQVEVAVRKFILPNTDHVAARCLREAKF